MEKPRVKLEMEDPEFLSGSEHTAKATITNDSPEGYDFEAELYLGSREGTSGIIPFTLAAGETKAISLPVTMPYIPWPALPMSYVVYLDISIGGSLVVGFQATEEVIVVPIEPSIIVDPITWD